MPRIDEHYRRDRVIGNPIAVCRISPMIDDGIDDGIALNRWIDGLEVDDGRRNGDGGLGNEIADDEDAMDQKSYTYRLKWL